MFLNYLDRFLIKFDLLIDIIKFLWHTERIKLSFKFYTRQLCINDNEKKSEFSKVTCCSGKCTVAVHLKQVRNNKNIHIPSSNRWFVLLCSAVDNRLLICLTKTPTLACHLFFNLLPTPFFSTLNHTLFGSHTTWASILSSVFTSSTPTRKASPETWAQSSPTKKKIIQYPP